MLLSAVRCPLSAVHPGTPTAASINQPHHNVRVFPLFSYRYGVWILFLFIALGTAAEEFFCPALSVISDVLGLSQNVAGVTFLAFGNGQSV